MKNVPEYFCRLPWTGFSNESDGKIRPCCIHREYITDDAGNCFYVQKSSVDEVFKSNFMKSLRQQFRENLKPSACSTCWVNEENGIKSKRQSYLTDVEPSIFENLNWQEEPSSPTEFQMILSNSCNLKCRTCTSTHSSLWQSEDIARNQPLTFTMPYKQSGDINGELWKTRNDWYRPLKRLEIVGGEPFYLKQWDQVFKELISQGLAKNITIAMSSNATIISPEQISLICKNFMNLGVGLSIDGSDNVFEYLRHPANWEKVYFNLKKYQQLQLVHTNLHLHFNITISWINAWYLPELYTLLGRDFPTFGKWNNIVHYPESFSIWAIPKYFKDEISKKWEKFDFGIYNSDFQNFKEFMYSKSISDFDFNLNIKKLRQLDTYRKDSIILKLPEIAELLKIK